jgi:RNA polymerase-associated protein CTR9
VSGSRVKPSAGCCAADAMAAVASKKPMAMASSAPNQAPRVLRLRLQAADGEYVAMDERSLPTNVYDVTSMLRLETAPRSSWRDVAAAYTRAGSLGHAVQVLEQASADDVDSMLGDALADSCSRTDLLAALAGAYVMAAESPTVHHADRPELLDKAKDVLARADLIDTDQPAIWIAKGAAEAAAGRADDAKTWFENAHQNGSVPAALGLAAILLNGTATTAPDPARAAALLIAALYAAPCPAGAWTGLGHALFRSGSVKQARIVLRRAVKATQAATPRERLEALYALARAESADPITPASMQNALEALREAYVRCGGHSDPRVLTLLTELHYLAGDPKDALQYASRAIECIDSLTPAQALGPQFVPIHRDLRAHALFERARALLQLNRAPEATLDLENVKRLVADTPSVPGGALPPTAFNPGLYLRLGLLKLASGFPEDERVGEECFEKILKDVDERCALAMRGLGTLLGRRLIDKFPVEHPRRGERFQRAKDLLRKGITADDAGRKDIPAMLVYAALIEETEPGSALAMLERASTVMSEGGEVVPPEVYSNIAALLARVGRVSDARSMFRDKLDPDFVKSNTALMYNSARLAEMDRDFNTAVAGYESVLAKDPDFDDARIRLGCIAFSRDRDVTKAEELFKSVIASKSSHRMIAAGFLNKLYTAMKNPKAQQELLEAHRGESDYMSLAFAQFMYSHLDGLGRSDRRHRFLLNHIAIPLQQVLKHSKRNAYAANGIGVLFAEKNMMSDARDAFAAAGCCLDATKATRVNLAHSTIALAKAAVRAQNENAGPGMRYTTANVANARGLCEQAEKLYSDAADEISRADGGHEQTIFNERVELDLYRANAKYEIGAYRAAADLLEKILHCAPDSAPCWFNLGQILRECAGDRVLSSNQNLEQMLIAKVELEGARAAFLKAAHLDRGVPDRVTRTRIDRKFLEHHTKFIQQVIRTHEVSLVNARNEAEDKEKVRLEKQAQIEKLQREKDAELRLEIERQEARKREWEELAALAAERLRQTEESARLEMERSRKTVSDDEDIVYEGADADSERNGMESQRRASQQQKRKARERQVVDDDEKGAKRRKVGRPRAADASSDEYSDGPATPDPAGAGGPHREAAASPAAASVSEEEDDEMDGISRPRARKFTITRDSDDD